MRRASADQLAFHFEEPDAAPPYTLTCDDVLAWAASYTGPKFMAMLCDPPYHLTSVTKRFGQPDAAPNKVTEFFHENGRSKGASPYKAMATGFMGTQWDGTGEDGQGIAFRADTWKALAQHLLPGAFIMAFASSRGFHRVMTAMEDAGLRLYPAIFGWLSGSSFPKATRIDTKIDAHGGANIGWFGPWLRQWRQGNGISQKDLAQHFPSRTGGLTGCVANWELGLNLPTVDQYNTLVRVLNLPFESLEAAEREVIGDGVYAARRPHAGNGATIHMPAASPETAPATPLAQTWAGHRYGGQMLKNSLEPIIVAQVPYAGKPVESIVKNGSGALWIDGGRVSLTDDSPSDRFLAHHLGKGRWPPNFALSHTPECVQVGTRRVKGDYARREHLDGHTYNHHQAWGYKAKPRPNFGYVDANGLEEVPAWHCAPGGTFTLPVFSISASSMTDVFVLSDAPASLLGHLQSLFGAIRTYSTTCSSPLPHVAEFYHSGRRQSADSSDGLACALARALGVLEFLSYPSDSLTFPHWCDAHVQKILMACRAGLPSLLDALDLVYSDLSTRTHNPQHLHNGHPSSSDDSTPLDTHEHMPESKISGDLLYENCGDGILSHTVSMPHQDSFEVTPSSMSVNGTAAHAVHGRLPHTAHMSEAVKLISCFVFDLAWRFLLPAHIIQLREIVINYEKCPVAKLDAQAGVRKGPWGKDQSFAQTNGMFLLGPRPLDNEHWQDHGQVNASRFFHVSSWSLDVAEQLAQADPVRYCPKASRGERDAGLEGMRLVNGGIKNDSGRGFSGHSDPYANIRVHNSHPTVKPIALCQWLATLLLPPAAYAPRRLLVPFSGTSSEMIGALLAGWDEVLGIEQDAAYVDIARRRLEAHR